MNPIDTLNALVAWCLGLAGRWITTGWLLCLGAVVFLVLAGNPLPTWLRVALAAVAAWFGAIFYLGAFFPQVLAESRKSRPVT